MTTSVKTSTVESRIEENTTAIAKKILRNTRYEKWMDEAIIKVAARGGHIAEMCMELGIKETKTYYQWGRRYKSFGEAIVASKMVAEAYWDRLGHEGIVGRLPKFNFNAYQLTVMNKFGDSYKKVSGGTNVEFNVGEINNNTIEQLSTDDLNKKIQMLVNKHNVTKDAD